MAKVTTDSKKIPRRNHPRINGVTVPPETAKKFEELRDHFGLIHSHAIGKAIELAHANMKAKPASKADKGFSSVGLKGILRDFKHHNYKEIIEHSTSLTLAVTDFSLFLKMHKHRDNLVQRLFKDNSQTYIYFYLDISKNGFTNQIDPEQRDSVCKFIETIEDIGAQGDDVWFNFNGWCNADPLTTFLMIFDDELYDVPPMFGGQSFLDFALHWENQNSELEYSYYQTVDFKIKMMDRGRHTMAISNNISGFPVSGCYPRETS